MATSTFYPAAGDGIVRNAATGSGGAAWTSLRNAGTGTVVDYTTNPQVCVMCDENSFSDSKQYIDRGFFPFDTSSLPDGATIVSASFNLYVVTVTSTAGGSVNVYESTQASTTTLSTADFDACGSTAWASAVNFASISAGAYNAWTLNSTGRAAINKTGNTMLCLRGSFDVNNSPPTAGQRSSLDSVRYSEHTGTGSDPYLSVEWYMDTTFTADAIVIATSTKTFTADAFIVNPNTKSVVTRDTLSGSAATLLSSHTPTGTGATGTWVQHSAAGGATIRLDGTGAAYGYGGGYYYLDAVPGSADYEVESTITTVTVAYQAGVLGRWDASATTGYAAYVDGGGITASSTVRLYKFVAGVATLLGSAYTLSTALAAGRAIRLRLRMSGTTIAVDVDDTERISVTDSSVTAAGYAGMQVTNGSGVDSGAAGFLHRDFGVFQGTLTKTFTADAIVLGTTTKTFTADAQVGNAVTAEAVTQGTGAPTTIIAGSGSSDSLNYNAFPGLCEMPNGNLLCAWHHANDHIGSGTNKLYYSIGTPDGSGDYTWSTPATLTTFSGAVTTSGVNLGDVGCVTLASGDVMVTWNESTTPGDANINTLVYFKYTKSSNNGSTWSTVTSQAIPGWATTVAAGSGGGAYAVAPCKPIQLANGDLIMLTYGWDNRVVSSFVSREYVKCMKSTDEGATWTQVGTPFPDTVGTAYDESDVLLLDTGELLAAARTTTGSGTGYDIKVCRSTDSGVTWGSITTALGTQSTTGWGGRPDLIQTPNGGVLLRTRYMNAGTSSWTGYRLSLNRGVTWGSGIDPYTGGAEGTGAVSGAGRGADVYGAFANIGSGSRVAYAWSEELGSSTSAVLYFRVLEVYDRTTATFTADAVVATRNTQTFTADAIVTSSTVTQNTRTFTADASVQELGLTKTFTADAVVSATVSGSGTYTKTFTADAHITADPGATFTAGLFFYSNVGQILEFWGQD